MMETFGVDKPYYEIDDFNDLWSVDSFDSPMSDIDIVGSGDDSQDWGAFLSDSRCPTVILNDRMMTEAVHSPRSSLSNGGLGATTNGIGQLISSTPSGYQDNDHSYSMANGSDSQAHGIPTSTEEQIKIEYDKDLDSDCLLAVPMNSINQSSNLTSESQNIKMEPLSPPGSPCSGSSCVSSDFESFDGSESLLSNNYSSYYQSLLSTPSSHHPQSLLKQPTIVLATRQNSQNNQSQRRMVFPKVNIKVEPQTSGFLLPPTPPSSSNGSDSESSGIPSPSHSSSSSSTSSSKAHHSQNRVITASVTSNSTSMKTMNHSALISSQPKGATGILLLTEEEKRTLIAEGYPIPQRLPLTKAEEKSLKKIRRKIKNKISAQESRRKKKEYMDTLEKKVEILQNENSEYKRRVDNLESSNQSLLSQLHELQMLVGETPAKISRLSFQNASSHTPKKQISKSAIKL